ncbi:hypothetical protein RI129_002707 [Pyrocoelia pectoralis]|uniref:Transposase domain-containing protein n=1 Tax=Pyrocoelia pectoralis TaxID=417401 RepID=A0AAN7VFS7_9COLE
MRCYSARHQRRLLVNQTKSDLQKIKQKFPVLVMPVQQNIVTSCGIDDTDIAHCSYAQNLVQNEFQSCSNDSLSSDSALHIDLYTRRLINVDSKDSDIKSTYISDIEVDFNCTSSSSEDELAVYPNTREEFKQGLSHWAVDYNVRHNCLGALLSHLRKFTNCDLPKDPRTLLSTPRSTAVTTVYGGEYIHIGLQPALRNMLQINPNASEINLLINIDGLPISRSSNACLWPILCSDHINTEVYLIGCYYGYEKPKNANEFLEMFVKEAVDVVNNGLEMNGRIVTVKVFGLICDVPAKSFVLSVKGHGGYDSCTKCTIHGDYQNHGVCFPYNINVCHPLRTDIGFINNEYEDYQVGDTIMKCIPNFGLVSNVPIDYMHQLCLGVMKKLITLWISGQPLSVKLPSKSIKTISAVLIDLQSTVPKEFSRKPRSLVDINHWKATEFRNFLLYYGPLVLKDVVCENVYKNFLALHVASRILISHTAIKDSCNLEYAANLLRYFVTTFQTIYGSDKISHNVHNLLHICDDVKKYGPLDMFSAFKFESYMAQLKRLLRKSEKPLAQLSRRYCEISRVYTKDYQLQRQVSLQNVHTDGPLHLTNKLSIKYNSIPNLQCW